MNENLHHLRKMKQRLETTPPNRASMSMSPSDKVEMLERTLSTFRSEVDMKLKIIQQILTERNEQVMSKQKLLNQERNLYETLLSHWEQTPNLVTSGVTMNFTSDTIKGNVENEYYPHFDDGPEKFDTMQTQTGPSTSTSQSAKPSRSRHRKRRKIVKLDPDGSGRTDTTEEHYDSADSVDADADPLGIFEGEGNEPDDDDDWNSSIMRVEEVKAGDDVNSENGNKFDQEEGRKRRRGFSPETKLRIIKYASETSTSQASRVHGISRAQISRWKNKEKDYMIQKNNGGANRVRLSGGGRKLKYEDIEEELAKWVVLERSSQTKVSRTMIMLKAAELNQKYRSEEFNGTSGWLRRFLLRYNFSLKRKSGVSQERQPGLEGEDEYLE